MTGGIARLLMVKEAVNSVAIEHGECDCVTCRAADGDADAMAEVFRSMRAKE